MTNHKKKSKKTDPRYGSHWYGSIDIKFNDKRLTRKQVEILKLIALGYTNSRIGQTLGIASRTVEAHIHNLRKLFITDAERLNDRKLVILAREFLNAYQEYMEQCGKRDSEFEKTKQLAEWYTYQFKAA